MPKPPECWNTLFLVDFFLKDSVLCSPGWSQIPCSWRWATYPSDLPVQCWVYGYEPLFLTYAQVHMCSIQAFFWAFKARSFTHKLHSYILNELSVSVVLLCNNFCLYKRDGLSTSYFWGTSSQMWESGPWIVFVKCNHRHNSFSFIVCDIK